MKIKFTIISAIVLMAFVALSFPIRDLTADYYYRQVPDILDDETTEGLDVMLISERTMPAYLAAIGALQKAAAIAPLRSLYQRAISDLYNRLGKWSEIMLSLNAPIPANAILPADASDKALYHLQRAVALEPAHPDIHLALGLLYDNRGEPGLASEELKKAANAYPVNAPLRYAIALHYLTSGRKGDALEQARVLAKIDDSYIIADSVQKGYILERQPPGYIFMLTRSYLYGALEIAWRVSADPEVVKGIAPDTPDAAAVVHLFVNSK
jgi:tetratricopeptide (TPR) repeat protein